jgi:hypothetical protein
VAPFAIVCQRCGAGILKSSHIGVEEAVALERHLLTAHPDVPPPAGRPDFHWLLEHARLELAD